MAKSTSKEPIPPNRLKLLREARELTQEEVADRCDTTHSTIQRLEARKRRLTSHWVYRLAHALDCHPGELFSELPETTLTAPERKLLDAYRWADDTERAFIEAAANQVRQPAPSIPPAEPAKRAS